MENKFRIGVEVLDHAGASMFSNLTEEEQLLFIGQDSGVSKTLSARFGTIKASDFQVRMVVYLESFVNSSRLFRTLLSCQMECIGFFIDQVVSIDKENKRNIRRLMHNLTTYNAVIQQEIETIVPQSQLSNRKWEEKKDFTREMILASPKDSAEALMKISRSNQGIKAELSIYNKLFITNPVMKPRHHKAHRVLTNTLNFFFPALIDKEVYVHISPSEQEAFFDYESVSVGLYHLVNNATKYCASGNPIEVKISTEDKFLAIEFEMLSIKIAEDETAEIFNEGFSGQFARKAKLNGDGLGMYIIKKLLELNGGKIEHRTKPNSTQIKNNIPFERNIFSIFLPLNASN